MVYLRRPGDAPVFEMREVVLGPRAGDYYLVSSGLDEGEKVVVNGAFKLDSAVQIQGQPSMMSGRDHSMAAIFTWLLDHKLVVLLLVLAGTCWGVLVAPFGWDLGLPRDPVPVDAIPDIGENQQIVFTEWPGRSPAGRGGPGHLPADRRRCWACPA